MIFAGSKTEIEEALETVTRKLDGQGDFFRFKLHVPKTPKTELPLFTYYVNVPTVLNEIELHSQRRMDEYAQAHQELKIEFIIDSNYFESVKLKGNQIFAVESTFEYNLLSINDLFADKLSTLGPSTVGIQNDRLDEQVKQFYDILMLLKYNHKNINLNIVKEKYINRARNECSSRKIDFNMPRIIADVIAQLERYSIVDNGEDAELKQYLSNLKSLYLNSNVDFSSSTVACAAQQIRLVYTEITSESCDMKIFERAIMIEDDLRLNNLRGIEKGNKNKELRALLIDAFGKESNIPYKEQKGKNPGRIFWSVVSKSNIDRLEQAIQKCLQSSE